MVFYACSYSITVVMLVLQASLLYAGSEARLACRRPRQELYVGEIRDSLMPHGPACPRCHGSSVVRYGKRGAVQRYKCKTCPCYFTDLTGSMLHGIRHRDRWLDFCLCMAEAVSRSRNKAPSPILLLVRPHSRHGSPARPRGGQVTLLRGPQGPFPARAGLAPPKARGCPASTMKWDST